MTSKGIEDTYRVCFCETVLQVLQRAELDVAKALRLAFAVLNDLDAFELFSGQR